VYEPTDADSAAVALESFAGRLRHLRAAAGMSQEDLAGRSGLSAAGIGALERGTRRAPQRETLTLLADALGLSERERYDFELAAERGRARIRGAGSRAPEKAHNLPLQLTSFVGRAQEIEQIALLIEGNRLVTVVGPGGVGKTRAALEVALQLVARGREDVRFVDLAPLQDGSFVVGRIASALDVRLPAADGSAEALAKALAARRMLLILDNCEHLSAEATDTVRTLLQGCPHIRILTTTRARMRIIGEVVHRLPPLTVPDDYPASIAEARSYGAIELFVQRGLAADSDITFTDEQTPVLIDVCRRLEGIPLAIELAAAQLPELNLERLSLRLEDAVPSARGLGARSHRQQTMRDTIAWSYNLLTEQERLLLRRLGIFSGGCTLVAAEMVCPQGDLGEADVAGRLASLVDKSLVNAVIDGENMRYVLLDSTRAFARERLAEAGEQSAASRRHAQWLAAYGETALREFSSTPNLVWLDAFWPEIDNVRSALEWTLHSEADDHVLLAGHIAGSFRGLWIIPGLFQECRRWVELVLARLDETRQPVVVANLLTGLMQTLAGAERLAVHARLIVALRHLEDRPRLAAALSSIAVRYCRSGLLENAQDAINEARRNLAEPSVDLTIACGELALARGQFVEARAHIEDAMALTSRLGDQFVLNNLWSSRAEVEFVAGNVPLAAEYSDIAAEHASAIPRGSALLARALCINAGIRLNMPGVDAAEAAAIRAFRATSSLGDDGIRLLSLQNVAAVAIRRGRPRAGARLLGSIEAWRVASGQRRSPFEEATYRLLLSSLDAQLGAGTQTHIAEGGSITLEVAIDEALEGSS
jgi:predicted ATPase/DNA-binding XRE family transcriptional regulator